MVKYFIKINVRFLKILRLNLASNILDLIIRFSIDLDIRSIKTLGDTLQDKGFLYAGQFCYLMAQLEFGTYANKNAKLVLLGGKILI